VRFLTHHIDEAGALAVFMEARMPASLIRSRALITEAGSRRDHHQIPARRWPFHTPDQSLILERDFNLTDRNRGWKYGRTDRCVETRRIARGSLTI
jgi:hypothetical protein